MSAEVGGVGVRRGGSAGGEDGGGEGRRTEGRGGPTVGRRPQYDGGGPAPEGWTDGDVCGRSRSGGGQVAAGSVRAG